MSILHFHICPLCFKEFKGRLNKKFCSIDCKASFNNRKATELRQEYIDDKILKKNYLVLKNLYSKSMGKNCLDIMEFYRQGFEFNAPSRKLKTLLNGYVCFMIHGFAYRVISEGIKQKIIVYNQNDLKNL